MTALSIRAAAASLAVIAVAGCTTTGIGTGQSANGALGATFSWTETGGTRGTMVASLTNGQIFQGQFFQITPGKPVTDYGPLWNGWGPGWGWGGGWGGRHWGWGWGGWGPWGPNNETITHYTGQVLANLQGPGGSCAATSRWPPGFRNGGRRRWPMPASGRDGDPRPISAALLTRIRGVGLRSGPKSWQVGRWRPSCAASVRSGSARRHELAGWLYHDPEFFAAERKAFLRAAPQVVCHESEIAEPGEWRTLDYLGESVFVIRGDDGQVRAFSNVCRHRGSRLVDGTGGCAKVLTCPYHAWSYARDGRLVGVPHRSEYPELRPRTTACSRSRSRPGTASCSSPWSRERRRSPK